ncbi:MAG: hypothetical protein ACOCQX_02595 [Candidatus Nanoarchaeia archaeon]
MAKAQGLSLNTIVIAALVVLVLVILAAVFMGRMGAFGYEASKCRGECRDTCREGEGELESMDCQKDYEVCCVPSNNNER